MWCSSITEKTKNLTYEQDSTHRRGFGGFEFQDWSQAPSRQQEDQTGQGAQKRPP
jgi:hypothetical protein